MAEYLNLESTFSRRKCQGRSSFIFHFFRLCISP